MPKLLFIFHKQNNSHTIWWSRILASILFIFGISYSVSIFFIFKANNAKKHNQSQYAVTQYTQAIKFFPFNAKYWEELTELENQTQQKIIRLSNKWHQKNPIIMENLGEQFEAQSNYNQAKKYYRTCVDLTALNLDCILALTRIAAKQQNIATATHYLTLAANTYLNNISYYHYPNLQPKEKISLELAKADNQGTEHYLQLLSTTGRYQETAFTTNTFIKLFYQLALVAYNHNDHVQTEKLFLIARDLYPEQGHFHIELTNFYASIEKKRQAREVIHYCQQFIHPAHHCRWFNTEYLNQNKIAPVGFLVNDF